SDVQLPALDGDHPAPVAPDGCARDRDVADPVRVLEKRTRDGEVADQRDEGELGDLEALERCADGPERGGRREEGIPRRRACRTPERTREDRGRSAGHPSCPPAGACCAAARSWAPATR